MEAEGSLTLGQQKVCAKNAQYHLYVHSLYF